jgi:curli biogenesis system outer membrane secretion channel CsgG
MKQKNNTSKISSRCKLSVILLAAFLAGGTASYAQRRQSNQGGVASAMMMPGTERSTVRTGHMPPYNGPRHVIAVTDFKSDARNAGHLTASLRTTLESALQQSNYFDVLDRSNWDAGHAERDGHDFGSVLRADYQVFGSITAVAETANQGFDVGGLPIPMPGGGRVSVGTKGKQTTIRMAAKIVDVRTGRVVAHRDIEGQSKGAGLRGSVSSSFGSFGGGRNADNPTELAAQDLVYELVVFVCESMQSIPAPGSGPAVSAQVLSVDPDGKAFVINVGSSQNVRVGDQFTMVDSFGFPVSGFGARVTHIQPNAAKCEVVRSERSIAVGDSLAKSM